MFEHVPVELTEMKTENRNGRREYKTPEGINLPSITTVLSILSRESIAKWRARVGHEEANRISHRASTRGTAVHAIVEKYINNEENFKDGYTPDIISSFIDLKPILDTRIVQVYTQGTSLLNASGSCGRVDCIGEFDGRLSVIDFKTSMKPKRLDWIKNYFMQESVYAIVWKNARVVRSHSW